jgi:hypothetical protein
MVSSGAGGGNLAGILPNADFTAATAIGRTFGGSQLGVTVGCAPAAQMSEVTSRTACIPGGRDSAAA